MKNKIAIYGGTFDPIHLGHLITVQSVAEKLDYDKIIFIPCHISPHKIDIRSTEPRHRLNMLKLAVENSEIFEFSTYELDKGNVSYTFDTLKYLLGKYSKIDLIIGFDNYLVFDKWKNYNEILEMSEVVVMRRNTDSEEAGHNLKNRFIFVDTPTIDISGKEIRRRIKLKKPIDFLVTEEVKNYIYENNLYK